MAPAFPAAGMEIVQTGAWMLHDQTGLPDNLEEFLANGTPPSTWGFGSMRASDQTGRVLIEAARALGMRAILSQGWANLMPSDTGDDCLSIGDVNHEKLFERVAVVVHHGGAGTTQTPAGLVSWWRAKTRRRTRSAAITARWPGMAPLVMGRGGWPGFCVRRHTPGPGGCGQPGQPPIAGFDY